MYLNATLFAQIIVFLILALFTMKFIWPPLMKALDDRAAKIADGLAAAEQGKLSLNEADKRSAEILQVGRNKVTELVAHAEKNAQQMIDEARAQAKIEADKVIASAKAEIEQEAQRAREALRDSVATLAMAGAEKILMREIDAKAHADLLTAIKAEL